MRFYLFTLCKQFNRLIIQCVFVLTKTIRISKLHTLFNFEIVFREDKGVFDCQRKLVNCFGFTFNTNKYGGEETLNYLKEN